MDKPTQDEVETLITEEFSEKDFDELTQGTGDAIIQTLQDRSEDIGFVLLTRYESKDGLMLGLATNSQENGNVKDLLMRILIKLNDEEKKNKPKSKIITTH